MQSEQELARVAAGRLGRKTRHGIYNYDERGEIRLPSPS
jgi:3-hydroxyacyl-CoA dehydrogenase